MRICTRCENIRPEESFYRGGGWCRSCRREQHAQWKKRNPTAGKATKLLENRDPDPTAYGKLHCEHVSSYLKRAIERYESKTGKEAPPELAAMHQLAKRLTDQQHAQLVTRKVTVHGTKVCEPPNPRECNYCGRIYQPRPQGKATSRYCSNACKERIKYLSNPESYKQKKRRYQARKNQLNLAEHEQRLAKREEQRQARQIEADNRRAAWLTSQQRWTELAHMAADMRRNGHGWQHIADTLGYSGPGAAHNAIRLRLHIDPTTLTPSTASATTLTGTSQTT